MNLENIISALQPLSGSAIGNTDTGEVLLVMTSKEYKDILNVIEMMKFAEMTNYKDALNKLPRLANIIRLIADIDSNPDDHPSDEIVLSKKVRSQIDSALKLTDK